MPRRDHRDWADGFIFAWMVILLGSLLLLQLLSCGQPAAPTCTTQSRDTTPDGTVMEVRWCR